MSEFNIVPTNLAEEIVQQEVVQEEEEVMDPETDCPVCFMAMETRNVGHNCAHDLCEACFLRIIQTTDKCPICREQLSYMPLEIQNIQYNIDYQYIYGFMLNTFNNDDLRQIEIIFESEIYQ